jgi:hypothetical protein
MPARFASCVPLVFARRFGWIVEGAAPTQLK